MDPPRSLGIGFFLMNEVPMYRALWHRIFCRERGTPVQSAVQEQLKKRTSWSRMPTFGLFTCKQFSGTKHYDRNVLCRAGRPHTLQRYLAHKKHAPP